MKTKNNHTALVAKILARYKTSKDIWLWKNTTGSTEIQGRWISFGAPGSPDIIGMTKTGRFVGIECKTGSGRLSPKQKKWRDTLILFGGLYIEARGFLSTVETITANLRDITQSDI